MYDGEVRGTDKFIVFITKSKTERLGKITTGINLCTAFVSTSKIKQVLLEEIPCAMCVVFF